MNSQQFDDIIKNKAQQHESAVPPDIWEGISNKKKKRRFPFFWFILLALLLGGGAITWNMNNKKTSVAIATINKTNNKNDKHTSSEGITTKNNAPIVMDEEQKNIDHTNKTNPVTTEQHITKPGNDQQWISLSNKKLKPVSMGELIQKRSVKKTNSFVNTTVSTPTEELFSGKNNKRRTRNKTSVKITTGETDNSANTNNDEIVAIKEQKVNTDKDKKISIIAAQADDPSNTAAENNLIETKKTIAPENTAVDSLTAKKVLVVIVDSSAKNKKQLAASNPKKKTDLIKGKSLKIEAGFTAAATMQEYDRPLYVKRTINTTAVHSEFISNKINTTIEPGAGLTVSLVKTLNKKWSAGVGVNYLRITERLYFSGLQTNTNFTIVKRLVTDPNGSYLKPDTLSVVTKDTTTINGRNIYNSFSIPVFVRYNLINRNKWSCSFTTGLYLGLLTKYHNSLPGKFETVYASGTNSSDSKNAIAIDIFAGLHFSCILWKKLEWYAEPGFRYNISKYGVNNLSFNKKIHSAGITLGIAVPLKK